MKSRHFFGAFSTDGAVFRYFTHLGVYAGGLTSLSWFLGRYNDLEKFFQDNRPFMAIGVIVHMALFVIAELARVEDQEILEARVRLLNDDQR